MIVESLISFVMFCILVVLGVQNVWQNRHSDVGLNVKQLIRKYGYQFENHTVQSEDGYLLELHRIPPLDRKNAHNRPPILITPGLWCSSADWVNMGVKKSLGFILAGEGYDVWLANYRGTTWSKKHVSLDYKKDAKKFFDYSFQEIGYYDLPAYIDYILNITNQKNLFYVGHSQGVISYFVLMTDKPNYNEKIRFTIALSPGGVATKCNSFFVKFLRNTQNITRLIVKHLNCYEILPYSKCLTMITQIICNDFSPIQYVGVYVFNFIAGFSKQLNKSMIPIIVSNTPAGSSYKQMEHLLQLYNGKFCKYDYGQAKNIKEYGQPTPPEYDLSKSKVPMAIFHGSNDIIFSPKDVEDLVLKLSTVVMKKLIPGFNHLDLIWGTDAKELVFKDIVEIIKSNS